MKYKFLYMIALVLSACTQQPADPFFFDGKPSPEVLNNYLDRAVSMDGLLTDDYPDKQADIVFVVDTEVKLVGRTIRVWGHESVLNNQELLEKAKATAAEIHERAPQVVLQGCCFEIVTRDVENIPVPAWAFESLGLPAENRNFDYDAMLYPDSTYVNHWAENQSVPDIRQTETQLWLSFLIGTYVGVGCECIHMGQTMLVGEQDKEWKTYDAFLAKMHSFYDPKARRHYVMYDAHAGDEGMFTPDGRSVLDYNAFPMRIEETPDKGYLTAQLRPGFTDAMYGKYPHPYLVEFDTWGMSEHPGEPSDRANPDLEFWEQIWVWGYDEASWFYSLPEKDRQDWLRYAYKWIKENDSNCHLQMPAHKPVRLKDKSGTFRAIAPTKEVPDGMNIAETIKELWGIK